MNDLAMIDQAGALPGPESRAPRPGRSSALRAPPPGSLIRANRARSCQIVAKARPVIQLPGSRPARFHWPGPANWQRSRGSPEARFIVQRIALPTAANLNAGLRLAFPGRATSVPRIVYYPAVERFAKIPDLGGYRVVEVSRTIYFFRAMRAIFILFAAPAGSRGRGGIEPAGSTGCRIMEVFRAISAEMCCNGRPR